MWEDVPQKVDHYSAVHAAFMGAGARERRPVARESSRGVGGGARVGHCAGGGWPEGGPGHTLPAVQCARLPAHNTSVNTSCARGAHLVKTVIYRRHTRVKVVFICCRPGVRARPP